MYRTRYQVSYIWNERPETGVRTRRTRIVQYYCCCCTYIVVAHIPISLLSFEGVSCRILFTSSANTPKTYWEGNLLYLAEGKFLETYFRTLIIFCFCLFRSSLLPFHCLLCLLHCNALSLCRFVTTDNVSINRRKNRHGHWVCARCPWVERTV